MQNRAKSKDQVFGAVEANMGSSAGAMGGGEFHFTCYDKDGNIKWTDVAKNIVVTAGLEDMNNTYFAGTTYTAAWYVGLVNASGFSAYDTTDTLSSHTGWSETTSYYGSDRADATFGAATAASPSVISNSASQASFAMSGTVTVKGAFLTNTQDKLTNTGLLFSVSSFQSPGDRSVVDGDTLNVTYQFTLANA